MQSSNWFLRWEFWCYFLIFGYCISASDWTMDEKGSKQVKMVGLNDSDIDLNLLHIFDIYIKSTVIFYALA